MDGSDNFVPRVVVATVMKHDVCVADGVADQVLAPELGGYCVLLPQSEVFVFYVHGEHGWMVGDLRRMGRGGRV